MSNRQTANQKPVKARLLSALAMENKAALIRLLGRSYDHLSTAQAEKVFADYMPKPAKPVGTKSANRRTTGKALLEKVKQFHADSLARRYYAPFEINSKTWGQIPAKTQEWTRKAAELLTASRQLSARNAHREAATCFGLIYELLEAVDDGDAEIIFGEEVGTWMVPVDEKEAVKAYLTSLAAVASPEEFTAIALRLLDRDRFSSWRLKVFPTAQRKARADQKAYLSSEIEKQKIKTGPQTGP